MTRFLPHLDDVGSSSGSVIAWKALREAGVVRCASVMVPCPFYPMARDDWLESPEQDMGVHITLTSEWSAYRWRPMIGPVPGLTDDEGFLHRRPERVVAEAAKSAVADEIAAQIERALADGIRPTHLDAHMGTALLEPFVWALIEAGERYDIPVLTCRDLGPLISNVQVPGFDPGYLAEVEQEAAKRSWPVLDRFLIGFCPPGGDIEHHYSGLVEDAGPGTHFLAMHADRALGMDDFAEHMTEPRRKEFEFFSNAQSADIFARQGYSVINWREI